MINSNSAPLQADEYNRTPLHFACDALTAERLVKDGADPEAKDVFGMSALHLSVCAANLGVCRFLVHLRSSLLSDRDLAGNMPIHWANNREILQFLLEARSDLSAKNNHGQTPAMRCCVRGDLPSVITILEHFYDVNSADSKGMTMLMVASELGHGKIVDLLLEKNADVNRKDMSGWTALHFASLGAWPQHETHPLIMKALLEHGADPNAIELSAGWRPLHVATDACAVRVLHEFNADLDAVDNNGRAAVHYLNADSVAELLSRKAKLDVRDKYGRTPMHLAAHFEKVVILQAVGLDLNAVDNDGKTPLDWAHDRPDVEATLKSLGAKPGAELRHSRTCCLL